MKKSPTNLIKHFIIKKQASSGSIKIFETENKKHKDKKMLLFAEIEASDRDNEKIIQILKQELSDQFFNAPAQTDEYAFENALAKANIKIKDILLSKPKNWLNKIHIAAVALCNDEIHIAPIGNIHAFLIHNQKVSDVLNSPQQSTLNPVKLFTNIVSGKLGIGNAMVLTNESVLDYLSEERIRKSAHEYDLEEALTKLSELLSRAPENKQFGLAVIKRIYLKEEKQKISESAAQIQKPDLIYTDEEEAQMQEKMPKKFDSSSSALIKSFKKLKPYLRAGLTFILSLLLNILEKIQKLISSLTPKLAQLLQMVKIVWKNKKARNYHILKIKDIAQRGVSKISNIKPNKQTISGTIIFLLIIVFVISVATRAKDNQKEDTVVNIQNQIQEIKNKLNEAQAALIYDNKAGTLALISESEILLDELSSKYPDQNEQYDKFRNEIENIKNRSEKKKILENVKTLITIIPESISPKETGIVSIEDTLIFYDGVQEKIAKIDIENSLLLSISLENQEIESFNTAFPLSNNIIAALRKDTVLIVDIVNKTINKQKFEFDPSKANAFASYGKNLYTFDADKNQIIRYRRAGNGFTSAQNWLNQEYELSTISDIAVDGFIYLIDTQGNIHTFLNGKFRSRIPWPAGETPKNNIKLYTNENIDTFYVLDSGNKKIVRITKNGELIEQLVAQEFNKAFDLLVDKDENNLYVLASDKIYQIPIIE
ncbi:hypothetical protein KKF64_00825 [Patescibacteria group bacterium]|nr:hypothetical protein [Patescibacteria group bacterium]